MGAEMTWRKHLLLDSCSWTYYWRSGASLQRGRISHFLLQSCQFINRVTTNLFFPFIFRIIKWAIGIQSLLM
jgi:hypothetical protein